MMNDDLDLLREYVAQQSEQAFETLVARYVNLVYSAALRRVGDIHLAEEVTQAVFVILAKKAKSLGQGTILAGWLYRTALYASADALKTQRRRQLREQEAYMQSRTGQDEALWKELSPLLDEAMARLSQTDRDALLLRYFENKSLREVGSVLGSSEGAAKKRVSRGLEKLRKYFQRRGIGLSAAAIAGVVSANSVHAAPPGLALSAIAATKGLQATATTLAIAKGVAQMMILTKLKIPVSVTLAVVVGAAIIVSAEKRSVGGGGTSALAQEQITGSTSNAVTPITALRGNVAATAPKGFGATPGAAEQDLSPTNLIAKSRLAYASLSTYRDSAWIVHEYGTNVWTNRSEELMGGRNLYRIEIKRAAQPAPHTDRYWSDGVDNFFQSLTPTVHKSSDLYGNLSITSGESVMPALFFNMQWGNPLLPLTLGTGWTLVRVAGERVGDVDCYVLERKNAAGTTNALRQLTLWIGKQDFLVRRWLDMSVPRDPNGMRRVRTETHENIVVNEDLKREDYAPNW